MQARNREGDRSLHKIAAGFKGFHGPVQLTKRSTREAVTKQERGLIRWLLNGDPAIRWQTLRDLAGASPRSVERERNRVAKVGWGARLLSMQDVEGTWSRTTLRGVSSDGGLYAPKWTSTTYTMLLLRDFGLEADNLQARKACGLLFEAGLRRDGGINYGRNEQSETCITGMVLSILSYFRFGDLRLKTLVNHLLKMQMPDGGWNCRLHLGATHASMNTTICVLEGLYLFALACGGDVRVETAAQRGREFLLSHRLFRSHRSGKVIKSEFKRFVFPPRWHYDILRALDCLQMVNASRDPRLSEAIDIVRSRQQKDGRWLLEFSHKGKAFFELEPIGAPTRWNTLRALRVLKWWEQKDSDQNGGLDPTSRGGH